MRGERKNVSIMEIKTSDINVGYASGRVVAWRRGAEVVGKILFSREMLLSLSCLRIKLRLRRTARRSDGVGIGKEKTT